MTDTVSTSTTAFQKATLENPDLTDRRDPGTGLLYSPERTTELVGSSTYTRLIAEGWTVVETWSVWTCQVCGMNDSDRDHAEWEVEHFGLVTHLDRYGHESVRRELVSA